MYFKRKEGFRFVFDVPLKANFAILLDGQYEDVNRTQYSCEIIDISPRGIKMFSDVDFGVHNSKLIQLEIHFLLDTIAIRAIGEIVWAKPFGKSKQLGILIKDQPVIESLIVSELKARRKREILQNKK